MLKNIIYLDNPATSFPKPASVIKAVTNSLQAFGGNPGRSGHAGAMKSLRMVFEARETIAEFFNLPSPERIVFTKNATEGLNLLIKGIVGDKTQFATSKVEHNAVVRPLASMKKRGATQVDIICNAHGFPVRIAEKRPDVIVTASASNVTGAIADIGKLARYCKKNRILLVVDTTQSAGALPLDLSRVDCAAFTGHKSLLGPQGIGFVYCAKGVEPEPLIEGGSGSESDSAQMPKYWPDRHEAGTINVPGIAGLMAGIKYLKQRGLENIREKEKKQTQYILERFGNNRNIKIYGPTTADKRVGLVAFNIMGKDPAEVADELGDKGIAVRAGLHCAPAAHRFAKSWPTGSIRVGVGPFTTKKEIDIFIKTVMAISG